MSHFHAVGDTFEIFLRKKGWAICVSLTLIKVSWLHPVWVLQCDCKNVLTAFSFPFTSRAWSLRLLFLKQENTYLTLSQM